MKITKGDIIVEHYKSLVQRTQWGVYQAVR